MNEHDLETLNIFCLKYPTWWYTIDVCDLTRDFSTAPQCHSPEAKYIKIGNDFDCGFMCDHEGTVSDAIKQIMMDIEEAIKESA